MMARVSALFPALECHRLNYPKLWEEPENTLVSGEEHMLERIVVAQTVLRLLVTFPSFSRYFIAATFFNSLL